MNGAACWANRPEENPAGNVKCMAPFGMPPGRLPAAAGGFFVPIRPENTLFYRSKLCVIMGTPYSFMYFEA